MAAAKLVERDDVGVGRGLSVGAREDPSMSRAAARRSSKHARETQEWALGTATSFILTRDGKRYVAHGVSVGDRGSSVAVRTGVITKHAQHHDTFTATSTSSYTRAGYSGAAARSLPTARRPTHSAAWPVAARRRFRPTRTRANVAPFGVADYSHNPFVRRFWTAPGRMTLRVS